MAGVTEGMRAASSGRSEGTRLYRICTRCIMDTTDPQIVFDADGVCNHCHRYDVQVRLRTAPEADRAGRLEALLANVRRAGKGRESDCVTGVSGGVDSTYVAYLTHQLGLRPLAVHFDNGWNSELAVSNIEKTLKKMDIELYTYVVDWEEFRDLQLSFLKAATPDGEVPTDHAIAALLYQQAARRGIRHILLGTNVATESIMPLLWGYGYADFKYIASVQRMFGTHPLRSYPRYSLPKLAEYMFLRRIRIVPILDCVNYDKQAAMRTIESELGWVYYGGKHYESIYTRFYQAYVLPRKFNIDKRRAHLSNLVLSGQMSRGAALAACQEPECPADTLREDLDYVLKKFDLSEAQFEQLMSAPNRTFMDYPNHYATLELAKTVRNWLRR